MLETRLRSFGDNTGGGGGVSFAIPLIVGSGGTGRTVAGSATMLVGVSSSGTVYDFYNLVASDNMTVVRSGTGYFLSSTTGGSIGAVYAATGNKYVVTDLAADLTAELRLVQSGNSITIDTTGNLIVINAVTNGAASGVVYAATGNKYVVMDLAADLTNEFRLVQSGNSVTIDSTGNLITINAVTSPVIAYARTGNTYVVISLTDDLTAERQLTASSGLTLTDSGAGANVFLSVNPNIRMKTLGFFGPGNLSTAMLLEHSRVYIPFVMDVSACYIAATVAPTGTSLAVNLVQWNAALSTSAMFYTGGNRPVIPDGALGGSSLTTGVLNVGSWLGINVDSVGSTAAGSNLTISIITMTS